MAKEDITPYLHNQALKQGFQQLGLILTEIMEFTPFALDIENARLENLLFFVQRYQQHGARETMESIEGDTCFPPIFPGISPESDWYRFELWMQGLPIRMKLAEQLPIPFDLKNPSELNAEQIVAALKQLESAMFEAGYGIHLNNDIPPRLVYAYLIETLGEVFELDPEGGWHLDGCAGYCPQCFQRPWCGTGDSTCWPADEKLGKMCLVESLAPFVAASPQSLEILQKLQAEADKLYAQFDAENPERTFGFSPTDEDWLAKMN